MLRINQIKLNTDEPVSVLPARIAAAVKIRENDILEWKIAKESVDARDKSRVRFIYAVDFRVANEEKLLNKAKKLKNVQLSRPKDSTYRAPLSGFEGTEEYAGPRPVVVGFGPCGMFAALMLAKAGLKPIVIERGRPVDRRKEDVERFWATGKLDPESNVQFGEGGAGTFSDGKLTTGTKDFRIGEVTRVLIESGADPSIGYKHMPHVGTDVLQVVVKNIREKIIDLGGEFRFETKVTGLTLQDGALGGLVLEGPEGQEELGCRQAVLAIGNAARDTFEMLYKAGMEMAAKPFSVGVRIEHPQSLINYSQYGDANDMEGRLAAAVYKLSHHCEDGRGVYTFCMCPGGYVVGSASEQGGVVTNGMSYFARDGENANSALLVAVSPEDCYRETGEDSPLAGMKFQRQLEERAFELGGGDFSAPVQTVGEFLGKGAPHGFVEPTYLPGIKWKKMDDALPGFVVDAMREALPQMARRLKGFDMDEAVMTGVETRSSSPLRIKRDPDSMEAVRAAGLYPGGEGAGYAGGIVSSAVDGIKIAEKIIETVGRNPF